MHRTIDSAPIALMWHGDRDVGRLTYANIQNKPIVGFLVGGEVRVCLSVLLWSVDPSLTLTHDINQACNEMRVYLASASELQRTILQRIGAIPPTIRSVKLIRQSQAERLVSFLLHALESEPGGGGPSLSKSSEIVESERAIGVQHRCFGKCRGRFDPMRYEHPESRCVKCVECGEWLSARRFVAHSHASDGTMKPAETSTVHWGFQSANWRRLITLDYKCIRDVSESSPEEVELMRMKEKFIESEEGAGKVSFLTNGISTTVTIVLIKRRNIWHII